MVLVTAACGGLAVWTLHRSTERSAQQDLNRVSVILAEETARSAQAVDLVVQRVQEHIGAMGATTPAEFHSVLSGYDAHVYLQERLAGLPQVASLNIDDSSGRLLSTSLAWPTPNLDITDRSQFIRSRDASPADLLVSEPVEGRITHEWVIHLTRAIRSASGIYLGTVTASVRLAEFTNFYRAIDLGDGSAISLMRRDGVFLARFPVMPEWVGKAAPQRAPLLHQVMDGAPSASGWGPGYLDRPAALSAVRAIQGYPLIIAVSEDAATIFADWDKSAVGILTNTFAAVIGGAILFGVLIWLERSTKRELAEMAVTDALTGLGNRRHLDERLGRELANRERTKSSLALVMIDVDRFKTYNDTYGHLAGDTCLQKIADILRARASRPRDCQIRLGGDEFLLVLPETGRQGALSVAEKISSSVADLRIDHHGSELGVVTVSVGAVVVDGDARDDAETLLKRVDGALYEAKLLGRNRVVEAVDPEPVADRSPQAAA